jgi:hypothetical protein
MLDFNETDPCDLDTDGDGIQDDTELGYTLSDVNPDTDPSIFQPDLDPSTTTDPLDDDPDNDGLPDGEKIPIVMVGLTAKRLIRINQNERQCPGYYCCCLIMNNFYKMS